MTAPLEYFHSIDITLNDNCRYDLTLTGDFDSKADVLAALQHLSMESPE